MRRCQSPFIPSEVEGPLAHRIQVLALIGRLRPSTSLGMNGVGSLYFIGLRGGEGELVDLGDLVSLFKEAAHGLGDRVGHALLVVII